MLDVISATCHVTYSFYILSPLAVLDCWEKITNNYGRPIEEGEGKTTNINDDAWFDQDISSYPRPRTAHAATVVGTSLIIHGGMGKQQLPFTSTSTLIPLTHFFVRQPLLLHLLQDGTSGLTTGTEVQNGRHWMTCGSST